MPRAPDLARAEDFILRTGRLIERRRFAALFRSGAPADVVAALRPYQNPDGGFGNALEPDTRGPESQPLPTWTALVILDGIDRFEEAMIARVLEYLVGITTPEGGVPFSLQSTAPRAPWMEAGADAPASVNPTAAIAALLHKHRVPHPWLDAATRYSWRVIEGLTETSPYDARAILPFLDHVPERARAESAFERLGKLLVAGGHVAEPGAEGEVHYPLDYAPRPDTLARRLFADDVIERDLDALAGRQQPDGGWPINWLVWTPATGPEWRAWVTVNALATLRAYERLGERVTRGARRGP